MKMMLLFVGAALMILPTLVVFALLAVSTRPTPSFQPELPSREIKASKPARKREEALELVA